MDKYIPISALNDYIFCPYSIYLHSVYMETDEDMFKATPQLSGSSAHNATNGKRHLLVEMILSLPVYSEELGVAGIIDIYKGDQLLLIERKNNL